MDEGQQEFVRSAYTFSAKLNEHAEKPKYLPVATLNDASSLEDVRRDRFVRAELSRWLVICANVVHAFAEAAEIEFGRDPDPEPAPPNRAQRK